MHSMQLRNDSSVLKLLPLTPRVSLFEAANMWSLQSICLVAFNKVLPHYLAIQPFNQISTFHHSTDCLQF